MTERKSVAVTTEFNVGDVIYYDHYGDKCIALLLEYVEFNDLHELCPSWRCMWWRSWANWRCKEFELRVETLENWLTRGRHIHVR